MRKMIFHIPMQIDIHKHSGSQIRPQKMIQAFKNIGYDVDVVMGYVKQRKAQIALIKKNIENGMTYDFLYSESSTMPTALTEKHHLPVAPFLDFNFFKFCNRHHIKIGLFYRDIHWNFAPYKKNVTFLKRLISKIFYHYDLHKYRKYLDVLYLPSKEMYAYIPMTFPKEIIALPPAVEKKETNDTIADQTLNFVYVGGLGSLYNLQLFTKVINQTENCTFNLCCREKEWDLNKKYYNLYTNKIVIHHNKGKALEDIYSISNIAVLFVEPIEYWKFVMAVKLFEYISFNKPIIAVKGTAVGDFVEKYNIGWTINYNEDELKELMVNLQNNPSQLTEKIKNIEKIIPDNTWEARALQVQKDLR